MSPSDKNQATAGSKSAEKQTQECSNLHTMDSSSGLASSSTSNITTPGHGKISNIPLVTANLPTLKCSINDQMKTFDPGEDGGIERLISNHCGNSVFSAKSSSSLLKNNKNYKAGSKINKLADMLAKRSQNVVEVTQNNTSDIITDITSVPKVESTVCLNNVSSNVNLEGSLNSPVVCFEKTGSTKELDLFRKSRRKSVPNQSCNFHQLHFQSTSKSCSDFSKLFPMEGNGELEFNALGGSLINLQTDESTKTKAFRKNWKNVELSLILPEKKRRSSMRSENLVNSKVIDNTLDISSETKVPAEGANKEGESPKEILPSSVASPNHSVSSTKIRKESQAKQRKSKRLVETSTQTADIEFISVIKPKPEVREKLTPEETEKVTVTYECLYCTQTFALGSQCKAHEKIHSQKNQKQVIKCQYCSKKLPSLDELKSHCVKKHPNKYAYCKKCDERFTTKEELYSHNKQIHFNKIEDDSSQNVIVEGASTNESQEKKADLEEKQTDKKINKQNNAKADLKIDVSFESFKKSSVSPRNTQKFSPKEAKTEEQLLEMEMLFYSNLSGNIRENLANHLDGKIDKSGNPVRTDQIKEVIDITQAKTKSSNLLSVVTPSTGVPDVQVSRAPSPYQTRSKTPNPLPLTAKKFKKLPNWQQKFWEKYNFPTNYRYEHRFWDKNYLNTEKSAFYLKDLSCLDIKTQLTMRENIKKLDNIKMIEENSKPVDKLKFPDYLSLVPILKYGNGQETKVDSQKCSFDYAKGRKQLKKEKEETRSRFFKPPGSELPVIKTRRKLSSDNLSAVKKQSERPNTEGLKMITRRQSSIDLMKDDNEESSRKRKGSLDMSGGKGMTLRRQASLDNLQGSSISKAEKNDRILEFNLNSVDMQNTPLSPTGSAEISGEWVRPRSYLCGTCCTKFTNLWELEDHKWVSHPNVWCTHYEFEDEKIDKLFQKNEDKDKEVNSEESSALSKVKLTDLYKRYLLPHGSLKTAKLVPNTNFPEQCTKCKKNCMNSSEMHKHMLDCGGDTTWFLTMYSSPMTIKRKWRPFGSRRRKQIGRRDLKRNIPSTPNLRSYHYQHRIRTKPGDVESIQKMLANLPEKRARRAINFDEIKTRSQATIHSNRLLRKRFKSSFANNFLKLKSLKQKRQIKQGKKETSSRSTTDTSSESTPVGSPKRRNKLRESVQVVKEENSRECSNERSGDVESKSAKKKSHKKKKEPSASATQQKNETLKVNKRKIKPEKPEIIMNEKPVTRSNRFAQVTLENKSKRKPPFVKEEVVSNSVPDASEPNGNIQIENKESKTVRKSGKKTKKKSNKKRLEIAIKEEREVAVAEVSEMNEDKVQGPPTKLLKKMKTIKVEGATQVENSNKKKNQWPNTQANTILRLRQSSRDKTELLKRIKKKFTKSKRLLELKEAKKTENGSRRSQRIKSLQHLEGDLGFFNGQCAGSDVKNEESNVCQKGVNARKSVPNVETNAVKRPARISGKSPKTEDKKGETAEVAPSEEPVVVGRRFSLRNSISLEEKQEVTTLSICENVPDRARKISVLRRNSKSIYETRDLTASNAVENSVATTKFPRIQIRTMPDRPESSSVNGRISLLKKNRLQTPRLPQAIVKLEKTPEKPKPDSNKNSDLAEMPILAKMEPIHGKISGKNEKDIPILMPAEKETNEDNDSDEDTSTKVNDSVSFQVIKKRRTTSKEVTPLKIIKKVENIPVENENGSNRSFRRTEYSSPIVEDAPEPGKTRQKRSTIPHAVTRASLGEKRKNPNITNYFLGIRQREIDKGRNDVPDESGSDSEPLISLVMNQFHKENGDNSEISETIEKEEEVIEIGKEESETSPPINLKGVKKSTVKEENNSRILPNLVLSPVKVDESIGNSMFPVEQIATEKPTLPRPVKHGKKTKTGKSRKSKKVPSKKMKRLRMTVTLKEPTLKIVDKSPVAPTENKWAVKVPEEKIEVEAVKESLPTSDPKPEVYSETFLPERRSRRISKETKSSSEFIIDDPLILVDELWSDLDSDSDGSKKKTKKGKKKSVKKKTNEEKKISDVNLEELLRNFGENKEVANSKKVELPLTPTTTIKCAYRKQPKVFRTFADIREALENPGEHKSYRRLSLKLFQFNKTVNNFGSRGEKLSDVKRALQQKQDEIQWKANGLPDLPFLAAEIKENPVQVIQCRAQKSKTARRGHKKVEPKSHNSNIHLKISLPLESINNMAVFNNNHLTELVVEEPVRSGVTSEETSQSNDQKEVAAPVEPVTEKDNQTNQEYLVPAEPVETNELKNKSKRSEVIDKIFYCEICKTYYYSSSQLKIHKLSNRHKLKESELLLAQQQPEVVEVEQNQKLDEAENIEKAVETEEVKDSVEEPIPVVEDLLREPSTIENIEAERLNEDTLEMPTLEGPFIESPLARLVETVEPAPQPPLPTSFGFSQENLKDIQRAIGCTDEEMLILTLLGENTIEIENDILDLDAAKSVPLKSGGGAMEKFEDSLKENDQANGAIKVGLKQRMTSALACLVNKAVFNLLQKYETAAKSAVNPEALSLIGKLSSLSRRKNILQLNELLKKQSDGETSIGTLPKELEKKEPTISYKYQCTICGSRFEKASTRECHISRSHKGKAKKVVDEVQVVQTAAEEDWNDSWSYASDDHMGSTNSSHFWCSDCGINFLSPQEVLEHQKLEHQAGIKDSEKPKETGPLQSSTIGSSDEIIEGKKSRRRPKLFSSEELDQQRIIANNELRKLDRKFSNKNKASKIKWGMDALRFTVEKENKEIVVEDEKEVTPEDIEKPPMDMKNIDLVPKLNLSRTSNIPEFKVIQKNSFKSRFQKIIDNKLKRKSSHSSQQENETDELEAEVMLVPIVVKKKNKKQKPSKYSSKKEEGDKPLDVYDFNESESESEPIVFSHIKKPAVSPTKLKLVKVKEGPSKNKADSTTKDLAPDDYDSEDSLPLSVVKKSKPGEEEDEKDEKVGDEEDEKDEKAANEDGVEKSEGILEQVEYLIEQLENETGTSNKKSNVTKEDDKENDDLELKKNDASGFSKEEAAKEDSVDSAHESLRVSLANTFLELQNIPLKNPKICKNNDESLDGLTEGERVEDSAPELEESILAEPESSQSTFDEEDSVPLVLMSKKADLNKPSEVDKKSDESTTDVSTTASEDVQLFRSDENKSDDSSQHPLTNSQSIHKESLPPFSSSENDGGLSEKSDKPFESLNGNVIYCRNDSMSDFSNDGLIDSNFGKTSSEETDKNFIKEVTEKEDVVIVCSKGDSDASSEFKVKRKRPKSTQHKKKENYDSLRKKKKRFPLLTATIEENNFRNSESPKLNKEVIVRKIWNRRKLTEESTDNDEDSFSAIDDENSVETIPNEGSQTEIEKEIIVKKIWSRKKVDHDDEYNEKTEEKFEDMKINQTEISDEVVIKCGPKTKISPKRRKSKGSINEASKDTIMRKIWSGKCTFQTKAALKTYDSDMIPNCKENDISKGRTKPKKRGRPAGFTSTKRSRVEIEVDKDDEDDLDSLLEEIEREQLEKAIRLEFLQLRRSEKANVEIMKEGSNPTVGLFTETSLKHKKQISDRKRKKVRKKIKHPKQSLLKRKKFIKKPIRRILANEDRTFNESTNRTNTDPLVEQSENSIDKNEEAFDGESKMKNRKHKKHRHKHHHHKHKHKKSKHHKCIISKHKNKHKFEAGGGMLESADSFTILEKICQDIPNQIENELHFKSRTSKRRISTDSTKLESKMEENISQFSPESKTKDCDEIGFEDEFPGKECFESGNENIYEFVEDVTDFTAEGNGKSQNVNY